MKTSQKILMNPCKMNHQDIDRLITAAIFARDKAYAPYSGFKVGAAIMTVNELIYDGCNIENASYSLTVCAERIALYNAIVAGATHFTALAVVYHGHDKALPCGSCLQVLAEFNPKMLLIRANLKKEFELVSLAMLLPCPFSGSNLAQ